MFYAIVMAPGVAHVVTAATPRPLRRPWPPPSLKLVPAITERVSIGREIGTLGDVLSTQINFSERTQTRSKIPCREAQVEGQKVGRGSRKHVWGTRYSDWGVFCDKMATLNTESKAFARKIIMQRRKLTIERSDRCLNWWILESEQDADVTENCEKKCSRVSP